jgi:hypothetical protein
MKSLYSHKRAMDANQMFIYITVVVVVGFVFIFGFRAVGGFTKSIGDVNDFQLQRQFTEKVTEIRADHDSSTPYAYRTKGDIRHVCLLDVKQIKEGQANCAQLQSVSRAAEQLCDDMKLDPDFLPTNVVHINQDGSLGQQYYVEGIRLPILTAQNQYSGTFHTAQCSSGTPINMYLQGVRRETFILLLD